MEDIAELPKTEKPIPQLKLEKSFQGDKIKESKSSDDTGMVFDLRQCNDYYIALTYSSPEIIKIFDKNGKKIDFDRTLNDRNINVNYQQLQDKVKNNHDRETIWSRLQNLKIISREIRIINEGKYILLFDENNKYGVVFTTENEYKTSQPPRNWKRETIVYFSDFKICPEDLKQYIENLVSDANKAKISLNNNYYAQNIGNSINIFKSSDPSKAVYSENLSVRQNICVDPIAQNTVYYCNYNNPQEIIKLDISQDVSKWQAQPIILPKKYEHIRNFQIDPTGNFLLFETISRTNRSKWETVVVNKDTLGEVGILENCSMAKLDKEGNIYAIDEDDKLVKYQANFEQVGAEIYKRQTEERLKKLRLDELFKKESEQKKTKEEAKKFDHLLPTKHQITQLFNQSLLDASNLEDLAELKSKLAKVENELKSQEIKPDEIHFITEEISLVVSDKEKAFAQAATVDILDKIGKKLERGTSIAVITETKEDIENLKKLEPLVDEASRKQIRNKIEEFNSKSAELFKREGAIIEKDVGNLVIGVKSELETMTSMPNFSDWQEFRLPQLISRLGSLANDCPLEASETQKKILSARRQLQDLSREYEIKFKEEYDKVRENASEIMEERVELMKVDIDSFCDRLSNKSFKTRTDAEAYVVSSEALEGLRTEIKELEKQNPDLAKELDKALKVKIANIMSEVERAGFATIAKTGQIMEWFGVVPFPKWESKVKEKVVKQIDIAFIADEKTKGPGITADKILGDVGVAITNSRGEKERVKLYEGIINEDDLRYGSVSYKGEYFSSYISQAEYRKIKEDYVNWNKGESSEIRKRRSEKRQALREWYGKRQKIGERDNENDKAWKEKYQELLKDYGKFCTERHILLLSRIDQLRKAPETEFPNGSGYVPEWQNHWTSDNHTEHYLEEMAKSLKMQLNLQEGILNLRGHAGTGKDVLVKMFCARTRRPYFTIDCSKWTTEFELSEDVVLEAEGGASKTVKVPSVILNAITAPGAVMYFNEINAMPEHAQIFLHGLMDEKRTLTLKTSSGKAVRALDNVLLISSMNPGYPGTFNPQFATKSRMVNLEIDYPPLLREKDPNDQNPNPPYNASEALRIARQVDSLANYTFESNLEYNDFVKIWDKYINGIENGAPNLESTQTFDLEVILTLVQFASKLREGFILNFEKIRPSAIPRGTVLVDQPITGREMRRCAYFLSKISNEEKAAMNPESAARDLLERFFLSHIDQKNKKDEIKTAMATWTSSKRVAA